MVAMHWRQARGHDGRQARHCTTRRDGTYAGTVAVYTSIEKDACNAWHAERRVLMQHEMRHATHDDGGRLSLCSGVSIRTRLKRLKIQQRTEGWGVQGGLPPWWDGRHRPFSALKNTKRRRITVPTYPPKMSVCRAFFVEIDAIKVYSDVLGRMYTVRCSASAW
jgi:hypothetical protein